ncbi:beta-galactosidase [Citrobacter portucalensis]|uniref:beta-galactosidase n=1 Tax=Citrobacter portucalensis TaxID=1639133 RepID=UPI00226B6772|nr:beta-galactosidase [Citrobacter portucalensis]MCX9061478.1 beta-galactosidase [Citrobacter portucalensis]
MIYQFKNEQPPKQLRGHLNLGGSNDNTTIDVNSHYLEKNGECWVPIMGEIHYSRVSRDTWKEELLKMKAGGITLIATYVFWIFHEEEEGHYNFTGDYDLRHFITLIQECGLDVVVRIGPWCHAELRNGGFPDWLLSKDCATRTDDAEYLQYVTRYWRQLKEQLSGLLFEDGGPICAIQLENELTDNAAHIKTLKELALEIGLTAPLYTATGWNATYGAAIPEYDVLPVFGGYADAPWEDHTEQLEPVSHYFFLPARNDHSIGKDLIIAKDTDDDVFQMKYEMYPFATCEIGAGIQVTHHRRPVVTADDAASLAMVKIGCGNNLPGYYMYHGGTNPIGKKHTMQESKATGYPNDLPVRSYDFQGPIGEFGQINPQYGKLKIQHHFLNAFGATVGKMYPQFQSSEHDGRYDTRTLRYALRTNGESGFVFVNNYQRHSSLSAHTDVQFEVPEANGTKIFPSEGLNVPAGSYFILPYNLDLDGITLSYATSQLLFKQKNTVFFMALEGIEANYVWDDGTEHKVQAGLGSCFEVYKEGISIKVVTLTQQQAEHLYVLDGDIFFSNADLFRDDTELTVYRKGNNDLCWAWWNGTSFTHHEFHKAALVNDILVLEVATNVPHTLGSEELLLSKTDDIKTWSLDINSIDVADNTDALVHINYVGDIAQLYVDDVLVADDFYKGIPWEVSLKHIRKFGNDVKLVISRKTEDNIYIENEVRTGLELKNITLDIVYSHKFDISHIS